jgi:CSLREA domain-containing protein
MTSYHHPLIRRAAGLGIAFGLTTILVLGMFWASTAQAAGIVVTSAADGAPANDGQCTLREAIRNANSDSTAGSSDCAAGSGADTITFAAGLDGQTIRLTTIGDSASGPSALVITSTLTLQGSLGAGIAIARDSAVATLRLFIVKTSGQLTISNLTLLNGRALGATSAVPGSSGAAGIGGAILSSGGNITLIDSTLNDNIATGGAGTANVAGAGGAGGAGLGGAIYADSGTVSIRNSTFSNNRAVGGAGGAGLTVAGAAGQGQGGGVYGRDDKLIVVNSTLSENAASAGGGIFSQSATLTATLALTNTILANSLGVTDLEARGDGGLVTRTIGSNNLIERQSGYAGGIASTGDPQLGPLANNGGPTQTQALLPGSPALDSGTSTGAPSADQRGQLRGVNDIGSYEAHPWLSDSPDQSTNEDTPLAITLQVGDLVLASSAFTISVDSSNLALVPNAMLRLTGSDANRTLTITPAANQFGTTVITITVSDGAASMEDSFTLTVLAVNDAPVAATDAYSTTEDTPLTIAASGVLTNDNDIESTPLAAQLDSSTSHGTLILSANGAFTYTPAANYCGLDSFSYQAYDGGLLSNSVSVGLSIACVNDAPTASASALTTYEDTRISGTLSANDIEGAALTYSIVAAPASGTISLPISSTGVFTYTPSADANGSDSFSFKVNDGSADSNIATVTLTITPVNDAPRFTAGANPSVSEDASAQTVAGWAQAMNAGAADESGQSLTFQVTSNSNTGLFASAPMIAPDGTLAYTPAAQANGSATIMLKLVDTGGTANGGSDSSATQTFTIIVSAVNDAPTNSVPGPQTINEDTARVFNGANGNLISVSDIDAGAGAIYITLTATGGTLTLANTSGLSFIFGDGANDEIMTFTASALAANAALNGLRYQPLANGNGSASMSITTNDLGNTGSGGALSDSDSIAITINPSNDAPVNSVPSAQTTNEDTARIFSGANGALISVSDIDAGGSSVRVTLSVIDGALSLAGTGGLTFSSGDGATDMSMTFTGTLAAINAALNGLTYLPAPNDSGPTSITLTTDDLGNTGSGGALTDTDTIAIQVVAVDDAPTIAAIAGQVTGEDIPSSAVGFKISDVETLSDNLTLSAISSNTALLPNTNMLLGGSGANRTIAFIPAANQNGVTTITLSVSDGINTTTTSFLLTVEPINDPPTLDSIADLSVSEDAGAQTIGLSGIGTGPANESGQSLTVTATSDNPVLITNPIISYISGSAIGTLTFTPVADSSGVATITLLVQDSGGTSSGGSASTQYRFTINVSAVNDLPTLSTIGDIALPENAPAQALELSGISVGPPNEHGQHLTLTATSDNLALVPNPSISYTDGAITATLGFALLPDANGTATISVRVTDDGGSANGGNNTLVRTFTISVGVVNQRPTLDQAADQMILEDAGAQTINLSGISAGAANESGQLLTLIAINDSPTLLTDMSLSYAPGSVTGTLVYRPAPDATGTAMIRVRVQDSGGTANGAIDLVEKTILVHITPVNDAPDFTPGPNQIASSRVGPQQIANWARGFTPGPADESNQMLLGYTIVSTSNPTIFAVLPVIDATGRLTYTPALGAEGSATIDVVAYDNGGSANGGVDISAIKSFTITIRPLYQVYLPRS